MGKGKVEILQFYVAASKRARADTSSRRKLSTYECDRAWCIHRRRWVDADGNEGAVAGQLAGRLRMNGTNV